MKKMKEKSQIELDKSNQLFVIQNRVLRQKIGDSARQSVSTNSMGTSTPTSTRAASIASQIVFEGARSHESSNVQTNKHVTAAAAATTTTTTETTTRVSAVSSRLQVTAQQSALKRRRQQRIGIVVAALASCLILSPLAICQTTTAAPTNSTPDSTFSLLPELVDDAGTVTATQPAAHNLAVSVEPEWSGDPGTSSNDFSGNNNATSKLKPVNFTLVDEIFESILSEEEVVKRWKFMDSQLQDGMKAILKMVFPQIVSISQDAKVSGDCSGGILKWILSLRNLRSWAIKMLDATGKPTAGIFEGSLTMFGNYRQCLNIRAPDEDEIEITDQFEEYFRGQYCVIHLKPWMPVKRPFYHLNSTIDSLLRKNYKYYEKTLYDELAEIAIAFNFIDIRMDLCVPSTCTVADIQRVAELLSKKLEMRAKVMRCDIATRESNLLHGFDRTSYMWLTFPLLLIGLSVLSTILVAFKVGRRRKSRAAERSLAATANDDGSCSTGSKIALVFQCLSISGAFRDRLSVPGGSGDGGRGNSGGADSDDHLESETDSGADQMAERQALRMTNFNRKPLPLYGLRNVFVLWFIIVQMTVELKYQYLRESLILRNMIISYWPFQIIVNSVLLFESLILITAFTYSYTCLESTLKDLIGYIIDKYIRLILSIITLIALTIVTPLIAIESPVWRNFVEQQSSVCKSTGYIDLFFLQNFISYDKICLPHTWLFCVEMQLIVLSIPIVLLLKHTFLSTEDSVILGGSNDEVDDKRGGVGAPVSLIKITLFRLLRSRAGLLILLFIVVGFFINFFIVYTQQLPPSWFYTFPDVSQKNYYFGKYLTKTWTHLSSFVIGLLAGHLCRSTLQLRQIRLLKSQQSGQMSQPTQSVQQPSPAPSGSTNQSSHFASRQSHGSTSTIMAMEMGSQQTDDSSTSDDAHSTIKKQRAKKHRTLVRVSSQLAALICMCAIIFSTFSWSTQEAPSALVAALYDASSRLIWCLALVAIMIQLCLPDSDTNKYSAAAQLLSHPLLTLLGRLSFLAYLISPYINTFVLAVEEQSLFPSLFIIFHVVLGNIVMTYTLAFILAIVIEQPIRRLISRFVLGKRFCKQKINISTYYANTAGSIPTISLPSKPVS